MAEVLHLLLSKKVVEFFWVNLYIIVHNLVVRKEFLVVHSVL